MPISLIDRRDFIRSTVAGITWLAARPSFAADADPHRLALLSDTHIPDNPKTGDRNCNMTERMKKVVGEITKLTTKPAGAFISGDLSWKFGTPGEYSAFAGEIAPFRETSIPLHLALGNHDDRANFLKGVSPSAQKDKPVEGRYVTVVELPRAELILLDSLDPKLGSAGECGTVQLKWLTTALERNANKPALIFVHHNPQWPPVARNAIGLADTVPLWDVLAAHKRVKALIFGHTHTWRLNERAGIHLINLPAVGYPFRENEVTGWIDARLKNTGMDVTVRALDADHPDNGTSHFLGWR